MSYRSKDKNGNPRRGPAVDALLTKIEDLDNATIHADGTMSALDKQKLDSLDDDEEMTIEEIEALLI